MGSPDECCFLLNGKGDENFPGLIIEAKSTQNLMLPELAEHVVSDFYDYRFWVQFQLGQLVCYMVNNQCSYGVLTSRNSTYFVHAELKG